MRLRCQKIPRMLLAHPLRSSYRADRSLLACELMAIGYPNVSGMIKIHPHVLGLVVMWFDVAVWWLASIRLFRFLMFIALP